MFKLDMQIQTNPSVIDQGVPIMVKISGDGARFSKSSNLILMPFSLPELQGNILSGAGILMQAHIELYCCTSMLQRI